MAVRAKKPISGGHQPVERPPKKTRQGDGTRSKPSHGRKKSVGQGK